MHFLTGVCAIIGGIFTGKFINFGESACISFQEVPCCVVLVLPSNLLKGVNPFPFKWYTCQ